MTATLTENERSALHQTQEGCIALLALAKALARAEAAEQYAAQLHDENERMSGEWVEWTGLKREEIEKRQAAESALAEATARLRMRADTIVELTGQLEEARNYWASETTDRQKAEIDLAEATAAVEQYHALHEKDQRELAVARQQVDNEQRDARELRVKLATLRAAQSGAAK